MRRLPVPMCALAFALALAACSSDEPATAPTGPTVPSPQPDVRLPNGMPAVVDESQDLVAISAGDLTPLVPAGATPAASAVLARPDTPIDQIAVSWRSGGSLTGSAGLIVWQHSGDDPAWRAVYAFTDPKGTGVFGVRMDQADVTGDGIADLLTFEDVGGSGACGTYRIVAPTDGDARQILRRNVCDTEIQFAGGGLRVREAVFEPDDPHCCPSAFRTTVLRWNGSDWEQISSEVSPAPGTR